MGLTDPVFSMSQPDILKQLFLGARGAAAAFDPATLLDGAAVSIGAKEGQQFRTPSGKLEFYSQTLADQGLPPTAGLAARSSRTGGSAERSLRLLTTPGYFQSHTAFSGVAFLREREGVPCAVLHPADAVSRGLTDGQIVRLA